MVVCWVQQEPLLLLLTIMSIVVQGLPQIIVVLSTVKGVRTDRKPIQAHGLRASGRCLHNTRHLIFIFLLRWRAAAVVLHLFLVLRVTS